MKADEIARVLELTFPWCSELVFLGDMMRIRKSLILRVVFHLKKKSLLSSP